MDFAETLVAIASHEEARRNSVISEQSKRMRQENQRARSQELAERRYEEEIFREAQRQNRLEEIMRLQQAQLNSEYQTGLWLTLITKKNLERGIDGLREILSDISHSGLRPEILDKLTYLIRLAGNDVKSYEEIEERVKPILIAQAKEQLRKRLEGNSHREYFIGYLK